MHKILRSRFGTAALLSLVVILGLWLGTRVGGRASLLAAPDLYGVAALSLLAVGLVAGHRGELLRRLRAEADRDLLRAELLASVSRDQRRISHELHDGVAQSLTGVTLLVKELENRLRSTAPECAGDAAEIGYVLHQLIDLTEARLLGRDALPPAELHPGGLAGALERLAERTRRLHGIAVGVRVETELEPLKLEAATQLYRIVEQGVDNAVRHGRPRRIEILIAEQHGCLTLMVTDDGRGFDAAPKDPAGRGLRVAAQRAARIGASLAVDHDGSGTRMICRYAGSATPEGVRKTL
jgi:signal transduction histidine kinase